MTLIKKTTLALCTFALAAAVGCGSNNEDNNANNANNANNDNNTSNTPNNTTSNTPNNTTSNTPNNTTSNTPNNTTSNTPNNTTNNTPGGATFCALECMTAADCLDEATYDCTDNRCVFNGEVDGCTDDAECTAQFSGWVTECQTDADCPGQVCVDIGDAAAGRCASEAGGAVDCATLTFGEVDSTKFEDDSAVTVCANTDAECGDAGFCRVPCVDDTTCGDLVCDTDTGNCICEDDSNCTVDGSDTCYDGVCGCAEEASCDGLEADGAMYTCE